MQTIFNCCLMLPLLIASAGAQVRVADARGIVGRESRMAIRYTGAPTGSPLNLRGTLKLGNPTVFYPERYDAPRGDSIMGGTLARQNDSIYNISVTVRFDSAAHASAGDTVCYLAGECLAGSDSATTIELLQVTVNGAPSPNALGVLITQSIGTPLPYVRFAFLDQNYPNPVPGDGKTTFAYRIDLQSNVTFYIYDMVGKQMLAADLGTVAIGVHLFTVAPASLGIASGAYWVRLVTESGEASKKMEVVR